MNKTTQTHNKMQTSINNTGPKRNAAIIKRVKLGSQLTATLESGIKLTLNHSCPPLCPGADQNVILFEPGLQKFINEFGNVSQSLTHNQFFNSLLELNFDPESNILDYVIISAAPEQNLFLFHNRADLLSNDSYSPKYFAQTINLNLKTFNKLEEFIAKHSNLKRNNEAELITPADQAEPVSALHLGDDE